MNLFQKLFGKSNSTNVQPKQAESEHEEPTSDIKILLERVKKKVNKKDFTNALIDVNKVLSIEPTDFTAYIERSKIKRELNDLIGADEDYETGLVLMKKKERGLKALDKAREKDDANDFKGAIKYYSEAIDCTVNFDFVYYYRALAKKYAGDYEGALLDFNKTLEINPTYSEAFYDRARLKHHQFKDYDGAMNDYTTAIKLNPTESKFFEYRGVLKNEMNNEGATNDFNKAIELNPKRGETYFSIASIKFKHRDFKGGISDLDKVIEVGLVGDTSYSMYDAYYFRGSYKSILKDFEGAIEDFSRAIELEPHKAEVYFERGEARLALEQNELAAEDKFMAMKLGYEEEN